MSIRNILAITAIAFMASVSTYAQDVREILTDRSSEQVMNYRKSLNDHDMLHEMEARGQYKDHVVAYDGNVTDPVRLMSKYQASQGFNLGVYARGSYFAGDFLPAVGIEGVYGYRNWYGSLWACIGRGTRDVDSYTQGDFLEQNFGLEGGYSFIHSKDHHHMLYLIGGVELKLRMDDKKMTFGEDSNSPVEVQYVFNGRTIGAYGGLMYQWSPRFSSSTFYVKALFGFNQNYKGDVLGQVETEDYSKYSVGGTKMYGEFTFTIGYRFNLFNKKVYNHKAMNAAGLSKADVKAMQRLANY